MKRIFGKNGPVLLDKNVGRNWLKGAGGKYRPHQGRRERDRRSRRQTEPRR